MAMTPAQEVRARKLAAIKEDAAGKPNQANLNLQKQMLAMMYEHRRGLKQIQSIQAKGKKKAELLPEYWPYVQGVLKADTGKPDEVIGRLVLWSIDAEMVDEALILAAYVMKHDMVLVEKFSRTTNVAIAEDLSELALQSENPVTPAHLTALYELVGETDMPDQVRVKLEKACGLGLMETAPEQALVHLKAALKISERAGVKTQIKALEKQLQESAGSGATSDDQKDEDSASGETPEA